MTGLSGAPICDLDLELIRVRPQGEPDHGIAVNDRVGEQFADHQDDVVDEVVQCPGDEGLAHHGAGLADDRQVVRQIPADGTRAVHGSLGRHPRVIRGCGVSGVSEGFRLSPRAFPPVPPTAEKLWI